MDFLIEFLRSLIWFVIYGGVLVGGVFLGKKLRDRKDKKLSKNKENS